MPCSKCGQQLALNVKFCNECGTQAGSAAFAGRVKILSNSSFPWIIAIISPFVALSVVVWVLVWVNIGISNGNETLAQAEHEQRLESIEQRLESVEHWFDSNDQRSESIEQRLSSIGNQFDSINQRLRSIENRFGSIDLRIDSIEQFHVWQWGRPVIPPGSFLEHLIEPGQCLASIAQIYWPHNSETPAGRFVRDELIAHLAATNNIADPEVIFAGTWLKIYEHPQIAQPSEWRH